MFELFYFGGVPYMTVLTLILIALLLTAWKAPAWVKEIGIIALVAGILFFLIGFFIAAARIETIGDVSPSALLGGIKVGLIPSMYGLIIYLLSLIIRITQKPRF